MNAPDNLDDLDDVDLAALSTRVLHDIVAKMTLEDRQRYRDALDAADAPLRNLLGAALGVPETAPAAPGQKCAICRGAFSGMSWDTLCPSCWEEKLRKDREAKTAPKFQWPTTASKLKRVAAELVRAAEMMGGADDDGEEADLVLSVAPTGWISLTEDRTGGRNEHPILTVHLEEYPEEGSYPVDPLDPTAGRPDESAAPAAGDARDALPALNADLIEILGRPNFMCGELATLLRAGGHNIKRKSEHEQAAVIHFLLGHYLRHGSDWRETVGTALQTIAASQQQEG